MISVNLKINRSPTACNMPDRFRQELYYGTNRESNMSSSEAKDDLKKLAWGRLFIPKWAKRCEKLTVGLSSPAIS